MDTDNNAAALILNVVIFMHALHNRQMARLSSSFMINYTFIECRLYISKVSHKLFFFFCTCTVDPAPAMYQGLQLCHDCMVWVWAPCEVAGCANVSRSLRITFLSFGWGYVYLHPSYTTHSTLTKPFCIYVFLVLPSPLLASTLFSFVFYSSKKILKSGMNCGRYNRNQANIWLKIFQI